MTLDIQSITIRNYIENYMNELGLVKEIDYKITHFMDDIVIALV